MIRQLQSGDAELLRKLRLEALLENPEAYASRYEDWVDRPVAELEALLIQDPVFMCFDADDPIGMIGLIRQQPSKMAHRASLVMVYVKPARRGAKVAEKLLATVVDFVGEIGVTQLELAVSVENRLAIRFYDRQGFVEVGRIPNGFRHEGRGVTDVIMVRQLAA